MAKFKVGDRVRIHDTKHIGYGTVKHLINDDGYGVVLEGEILPRYYTSDMVLSIEPKPESTYKKPLIFSPISKHDIYVNGKVRTHGVETIEQPCNMPHEPKRLRVTFIEHTEKLPSQEVPKVEPKQDNAFKLDPHEFPYYHFSLNEDVEKKLRNMTDDDLKKILSKGWEQYQARILGVRPTPILKGTIETIEEIRNWNKPKNRIPDRVVFDESKGKVTVLISKFNDGLPPYRSYTSKVNVEGGDKYDEIFGFLLSYYKYLNRSLPKEQQQYLIGSLFSSYKTNKERLLILEGSIGQEIIKLFPNDLHKWVEIKKAIFVKKGGNKYWDHLEWKEMLRVHELETKREKQREVNKEIKKHQKAIEELKKKEV